MDGAAPVDLDASVDATPPEPPVPVWADTEALAWLNLKCAACHGIDAKGVAALYYSAWPMAAGGVSKAYLETSELTPVAYQTILNRLIGPEGVTPSPMPVAKPDAAARLELRAILAWFDRALPLSVVDADGRYGNDTSTKAKVILNFKCEKPSTLRQFMSRFFYGALDRPPNAGELSKYTTAMLDAPVTVAQRLALVTLIETTLKTEFLDSGLRKLGTTIGGGPSVANPPALPANVINDLRDEFYNLMRAKYNTTNYHDLFTMTEVMVSPATASLYAGCTGPASGWASCAIQAPRDGYFTTVGFLTSKPMSFMQESNNYGRVSRLYFTVYGETLLPATAGPSGEAIPALPTCLEGTDTRTFVGAPRGAAAVPLFGKVCQSCHLGRHMAAGAVLFRPYARNGSIFDTATLGNAGTADADQFMAMTGTPDWKYTAGGVEKPVDAAYLKALLSVSTSGSPAACILEGSSTYVPVKGVADLANKLMSNKAGLSRGFMRHAHRAFQNSPNITLEMGLRAMQVYDGKTQHLPDLVRAYFLSDSLACEVQ